MPHPTTTMRRPILTLMVLAVALILLPGLACSGNGANPTTQPDHTQQALRERVDQLSTEVASLRKEQIASDSITLWQGQDLLGREHVKIKSLVGEKPAVINFWAAGSPLSRAELTELQSFYEKYGDQVIVLGVDVGPITAQGTPEQGVELLKELGITFPAGYTKSEDVLSTYGVTGIPTTIFIDADSNIHAKWAGALNNEILAERAEEMLENNAVKMIPPATGRTYRPTPVMAATSPAATSAAPMPTTAPMATSAPAATTAPPALATRQPTPTIAPTQATSVVPATMSRHSTIVPSEEEDDCDQLLRNQLKFQRGASTAARMNEVIRQIQNQGDSCMAEHWNPMVDDTTGTPGILNCFEDVATATGNIAAVGITIVPAGLRTDSNLAKQVRTTSGRDSDNNLIVYWSSEMTKRPADGSVCWLYAAHLNVWDESHRP